MLCFLFLVINLVSAVDLSLVNVIQGLVRGTNSQFTWKYSAVLFSDFSLTWFFQCFAANHVYTGLASDPLSKSLVLNSRDGKLQFYRPDTDNLGFTVSASVLLLIILFRLYFT